ncbi:Nitrilotriacetate monooxygenase component A/pristinamycin IIA synthase subunit A [Diplocarpon rosae]|nr:Nitrilotriacetate monooxygenase component A/pristinamycin IIA synthase subunit A [Diplocarpon rosae]
MGRRSAMVSMKKSLGFDITIATTYEQPYDLARRLSTIDHLTKRRVGWNVSWAHQTSRFKSISVPAPVTNPDLRHAIADEYLDVMYKLWEFSWRDDVVIRDAKRGFYTDPTGVREISRKILSY